MDQQWLDNLNQDTALVVPTRSLATAIGERVARRKLELGEAVWETSNIVVWPDYARMVWQLNRNYLSHKLNAHSVISPQQALLLWSRVIESSRRKESALTLLNVQQTARAAQRSWRLMHDWRIDESTLTQEQDADIKQYVSWVSAYQNLLAQRNLIDEALLVSALDDPALQHPFKQLVMVSYDLVTAAQQAYLESAQVAGVVVSEVKPQHESASERFDIYPDGHSEIRATLQQARALLEQEPTYTINVVIPDLQHRQAQVQELARDVFYPAMSPLQIQENNKAYQFSLGQALHEWPAIESALSVINLLKNKTTLVDLSFVLRNDFLTLSVHHREECRGFERWLKRQRTHILLFEKLPDWVGFYNKSIGVEGVTPLQQALKELVALRQSVQQRLSTAKQNSGFAALGFNEWLDLFSAWLAAWGWRCAVSTSQINSVPYQLQQRWFGLLEEFAGLSAVQRQVGMSRAIDVLQQMVRDTIFLPKAAASPILISGVLEAIGREADACFVTGMDQDFPAPPQDDAFIPKRVLLRAGHPEASNEGAYQQAVQVMHNLLSCTRHRTISYARISHVEPGIVQQVSPLFRDTNFSLIEPVTVTTVSSLEARRSNNQSALESYIDTQGPAWADPGQARGGSKIFENQSNCAFKAFVTHQLRFVEEDESEFGLDGLDRGNVIHHLLYLIWGEVQTHSELVSLDEPARVELIDRSLLQLINDEQFSISADKRVLVQHELPRLRTVLLEWLALEATRPTPFSVIEREEPHEGVLSGIRFRYVLDRVDLMDDGRSAIIDYKTGEVTRNDWKGERLRSPQLPLYALALDAKKKTQTSGIAFAKVKRGESAFVELAEQDIFRKPTHYAKGYQQDWFDHRAAWPRLFEQLAADFLAGDARVNPIDENTCAYCELQAICRVSQLRTASAQAGL